MDLLNNMRSQLMPGEPEHELSLDSATSGGAMSDAEFTEREIALNAIAAIHQWLETEVDDLEDGENLADRLQSMFIGIADEDQDGELDDNEQIVMSVVLESAWGYLSGKGIDDSDVGQLLNDWDDGAGERISDLLSATLPDDVTLDAAITLDASYKSVFAVRKGQKVRISKRISGSVRLSPKQKLAIKKARMKAHSASARASRLKSMAMRKKLGM